MHAVCVFLSSEIICSVLWKQYHKTYSVAVEEKHWQVCKMVQLVLRLLLKRLTLEWEGSSGLALFLTFLAYLITMGR